MRKIKLKSAAQVKSDRSQDGFQDIYIRRPTIKGPETPPVT